jgi:hypothetical protein
LYISPTAEISLKFDLLFTIEYGTLYNYADDNTLSNVNDNYEKLIDILEKESSVLID